jgi:biotin carboxyl carrier protein
MNQEEAAEFHVKVNGFEFHFTKDQIHDMDVFQKDNGHYHLIKDYQSYTGIVIRSDASGKNQVIQIDGEYQNVQVKDPLDQVLDKMGYSATTGKHLKEIKAPMPGLVLQLNVTEGQEVKEGDKILILVAMKMENLIAIHADATIKKINIKAGQAVEKGQVMIELD